MNLRMRRNVDLEPARPFACVGLGLILALQGGCIMLKDVGESADDTSTGSGDGTDSTPTGSGSSTEGGGASSDGSGSDAGSGSDSADSDPTADGDSTTATGNDEQILCEDTQGTWLEDTCGHWLCNQPPICDAIIPGCMCPEGESFDPSSGCVEDPSCGDDQQEMLCVNSGGTWDETACGHYQCGVPNECEAVIPGCDCGGFMNFFEGEGCSSDASCAPGIAIGEPCVPTADDCVEGATCCYPCGIPGCEYVCTADDPASPGQCPPPPPSPSP